MSTTSDLGDAMSLSSLLEDLPLGDDSFKYASRKLRILQPTNSTYGLNINFDMEGQVTQWTDLDKAFLSLPLTITTAVQMKGAPLFPTIAFKSSALSVIQRIVVKTGSGQVILDEANSGAFATHLQMMCERDQNWLKLTAPEIHYARDRCHDGLVGLHANALIANPSVAQYTAAPSGGVIDQAGNFQNPAYNVGFHERNSYLMRSCYSDTGAAPAFDSTTYNCKLRLPLAALHDFFRQLTFPLFGTRLMFEFYLQNAANSNFNPITIGSVLPAQTQSVGGAVSVSVTPGSQPRLYHHIVELRPSQSAIMSSKLASGFQKKISFRKYDLLKDVNQQLAVAPGATFQQQLTTAGNAVRRLWIMCYPAGQINTTSHPSVLVTGPSGLTNLQVMVNGTPQYDIPLSTLEEQYDELKQAMSLGVVQEPQALLTYHDFKLTSRIMCIDLTRALAKSTDPNAPISIQLNATVAAPSAVDIVYLIESEVVCQMDYTNGGVMLKVGPALVQ